MNLLYCMLGILIPFIGTCFGSCFVFFLKRKISHKFHKVMIGFASGVMIAASIWSLIIPSVEMAEAKYNMIWFPAVIGLVIGILFLIFVDTISQKIQTRNDDRSIDMLMFSVTLHNIPEGMAVGVCFASALAGNAGVSLLSAIVLAVGIAIQNIPEGAIISLPLKLRGVSKKKAFITGVMSGVVEPIASLVTIMLVNIIVPVLPYLLSFAAGAMIYVVFEELIPEMHTGKKSVWGIISVVIGFSVMMILDITLG